MKMNLQRDERWMCQVTTSPFIRGRWTSVTVKWDVPASFHNTRKQPARWDGSVSLWLNTEEGKGHERWLQHGGFRGRPERTGDEMVHRHAGVTNPRQRKLPRLVPRLCCKKVSKFFSVQLTEITMTGNRLWHGCFLLLDNESRHNFTPLNFIFDGKRTDVDHNCTYVTPASMCLNINPQISENTCVWLRPSGTLKICWEIKRWAASLSVSAIKPLDTSCPISEAILSTLIRSFFTLYWLGFSLEGATRGAAILSSLWTNRDNSRWGVTVEHTAVWRSW